MRSPFFVAVFTLICANSARAVEISPAKAVLSSDSICHTFDSQHAAQLRYTCFVHSKQTSGQDVSTREARAHLVEHKLSAVCSKTSVLSDELFLSEGQPAVSVWRLEADCTLRSGA